MSRPAKRAPASLRQLQPIGQSFGADADGAERPIASGVRGWENNTGINIIQYFIYTDELKDNILGFIILYLILPNYYFKI